MFATCGFVIDSDELGTIQAEAEESARSLRKKNGWQTWGDAFHHYQSKGFDEGYCMFIAYEWERRQVKAKETTP